MRPLIRKTINIYTNTETHLLIKHSNFSTSQQTHLYSSRRHEDESRLVRVSVWWDFENCALPKGIHPYKVAQSITSAVRANGIKGPIQITAFGNVMELSRSAQEDLSSTGITVSHVPNGGKNSADRSLLVDLMYWVSQNPPPAHLFLISGDRDFASILHRLRLSNYNILLSSPESAPGVLCSAASIMWHWNALVKGEDLTGKHFNQPPDGPSGSWYGHYRLPLEDPFAVTEQNACSQLEGLSESGSDTIRPVPKEVEKELQRILNSFPDGIGITDLRRELYNSDVIIDRDLYGHQKFSRFLSSMPHILNIKALGEGRFSIRRVASKSQHFIEENSSTISNRVTTSNEDVNQTISTKSSACDSFSAVPEEKSSVSSPKVSGKESLRNLQAPTNQLENPPKNMPKPSPEKANSAKVLTDHLKKLPESLEHVEVPVMEVSDNSLLVETVNGGEVTNSHPCSLEEQNHVPEKIGYLSRIWRKWTGAKDSGPIEKQSRKLDTNATCVDSLTMAKEADSNSVKSSSAINDPPVCEAETLCLTDESVPIENVTSNREFSKRSSRSPGFFSQIINWCKFWSTQDDNKNLDKGDNLEKLPLLSTESFWNEMHEFINTPKGSNVVGSSMTRSEMAEKMLNQGPPFLGDLRETDLLHLVDLLISEKKWVEECLTEKYPFKLIQPADIGSSGNPACKGLSSIGLDTQSHPGSQSTQKQKENGYQGGDFPIEKIPFKSKAEVLADCRQLVEFIVKNFPQGFSIGRFQKYFLQKYGYSLELQKFSYGNLVRLVQTMPGVKIKAAKIMPAVPSDIDLKSSEIEVKDSSVSKVIIDDAKSNLGANLCDTSKTSNQLDSAWEELGPITHKTPKRQKMGSSSKKKKDTVGKVAHDYETLLDNNLSGSDEENLSSTKIDGHKHFIKRGEDSSLLQILDSWYQDKEDGLKRVSPDKVDDNCCRKDSVSSSAAGTLQDEAHVEKKLRPSKSYTFVLDEVVDDKDKLIDGILGSLKKSGERSAESGVQP